MLFSKAPALKIFIRRNRVGDEDSDKSVGGVTAMNKCLLRVDEAAMLLSVSRWTIYRWVQEGRLEATKVGKGSLRIFQTSVVALIEHNRTTWTANRLIIATPGRL